VNPVFPPSPAAADFAQLAHEHRILLAHCGAVQARCSRIIAEQAAEIERLQADRLRLRAAVIVRETALAVERENRARLEARIPGLPRRVVLAQQVEALLLRIQALMRERPPGPPFVGPLPERASLRDKAVLCVGPDGSEAGVARQVVEMAGGQFLRHTGEDGGSGAALDASLVAADLVICQTGCVSHDAYWRVQDHCKRTGKQCVLVAQPQALLPLRRAETEKGR
jgi:hypothetical protein